MTISIAALSRGCAVVLALGASACSTVDTDIDVDVDLLPSLGCSPDRTLSLAESRAFFPEDVGDRSLFSGSLVQVGSTGAVVGPGWVYTSETAVTGTRSVGGGLASVVLDKGAYGDGGNAELDLEVDDSGVWNRVGRVDFPGPYHEVKFPLAICSAFTQFHQSSRSGTAWVEMTSIVRVEGFEDVPTPLGTIPDCLRIQRATRHTVIFDGQSSPSHDLVRKFFTWYKRDIGLVRRTTTLDISVRDERLMGSLIGGVGRGAVPVDALISGLAAPDNTWHPGRFAVASDGDRFLVVAPKQTGSATADLIGMIVSREGKTEMTFPIVQGLSSTDSAIGVDAAFDGERYLVAFNDETGALQAILISTDGSALGSPIAIASDTAVSPLGEQAISAPAVAFGGGTFLVVYGKDSHSPSGADLWATRVSPEGSITGKEILISAAKGGQVLPAVAFDGKSFFTVWQDERALFIDDNTDIYGARVTPAGDLLDPAAIAVSTAPRAQSNPHVVFDGARHIVVWHSEAADPMGKNDMRIARVGVDGSLLSGPASAGGVPIAAGPETKNHPRAIAFAKGTLLAWESPAMATFFGGLPLAGVRLDAEGNVLEDPPQGNGVLLSRMSSGGGYYAPAMASGGDRTLLLWGTGFNDQGRGVINASLLFP